MKRSRFWLLTLISLGSLLALGAGCGPGSAPATIPMKSGTSVGSPALAFDKLEADLGTVPASEQGVQTYLMMNHSDEALRVGPVDAHVEEGCDAVEVLAGEGEMGPNRMTLLSVGFGPHQELGPHTVRLSVPSNDPARPLTALTLHFDVRERAAPAGTGPRLSVDKELIDIGRVPYDWPLYERFTLRNVGDAPLVLREDRPPVRVEEGC